MSRWVHHVSDILSASAARVGWSELVESMRSAIGDRSHALHLGIGLAVLLGVWVNWRLARWWMRRSRPGS